MAKILIADDEELIRRLIGDCLEKEGHTVLEAADGQQAIDLFAKNPDTDMALLDIMMPEVDGWQVCRRIRETSGVPVILVSARSQDFDQIMGFESGADDYVTKPFSLAVLMRRINSLLQRGSSKVEKKPKVSDEIVIDNLSLNVASHVVLLDGKEVDFTYKEYKLFKKLCVSAGRVYTREQLLDEVWGSDYFGETRTVDSHMARLRTKLGDWGVKHIVTIYGIGYKIDVD
jgi:DNA-binding response OmpR family regulator